MYCFPGEFGSFESLNFNPDGKTMIYVVQNITINEYSRKSQETVYSGSA